MATELEKAAAKYRRTYDRLYVASMQAGSAEESDAINAKLAKANAEYEAAKAKARGCHCPGDCNCRHTGAPFHRTNFCGCRAHEAVG